MIDAIVSFIKVWRFFKSFKRAYTWFTTSIPLLGHIKPIDMVKVGRAAKLRKFVTTQLSENKPPKEYRK